VGSPRSGPVRQDADSGCGGICDGARGVTGTHHLVARGDAATSASRLIDTSRIAEKARGTIDTTTRVAIRAVTIRSRGLRGIGITRGF